MAVLTREQEIEWRLRLFDPTPPAANFRYPPRRRRIIRPGEEELPLAEGELVGATPGELARVGRTRVWSTTLREAGVDSRATAVSPSFIGPAIVESLTIHQSSSLSSGDTTFGIGLWWAEDDSGGGNNQAFNVMPPGTSIFETTHQQESGFANRMPGWTYTDTPSALPLLTIPLSYEVGVSLFYLKVSLGIDQAGATAWTTSVVVRRLT